MTTTSVSAVKTHMDRVFNFSPGPAVIPLSVLEQAQRELVSLPGLGMSVLEISHRSDPFLEILAEAQANLRKLMEIPDDYDVLFLQGGSRLQFSMVPINLMHGGGSGNYILTGSWGKKAYAEAKREGTTHVCWDGKSTNYDRLPTAADISVCDDAAYVHYTSNETIEGVQFPELPFSSGKPLVCDASSDFLSRPVPIGPHGVIYACAQKNAGPAGVTVVVIRKELVAQSPKNVHSYLSYKEHADNDSMMNTPPTFGIYLLNLIARWLLNDIGGLAAMDKLNRQKATLLYDALDASDGFYAGHAQPNCRSLMNVTFRLPNDELEQKFLAGAEERGLVTLQGHRSVGGIRASIYNAMPLAGVTALRDFMTEFQSANQR